MKRIITFLILFAFISIGMRAAIDVYATDSHRYIGDVTVSGYGIYGATTGDIAKLLDGSSEVTVNWHDGASLENLKAADLVRIGNETKTALSKEDLQALEKVNAKFIDLDCCTLAEGAKISDIKASANIEAVSLPQGLTKDEVKAANDALAACNANFGSCISKETEVTETPVTNYYYTEGSNSGQKVVESNTVVLDKANLKATVKEDVTVDLRLKEGYPKYKYTNTWNNNKEVYVADTDIEEYEENGQTKYRIMPNPLEVAVKKHLYDSSNNDRTNDAQKDDDGYYVITYKSDAKIIVYQQEGKEGWYNDPECTDRNWNASNVQQDDSGNYYYIGGAHVKEYLTESYTYYNPKTYQDVAYTGTTPTENPDGSLTGTIENTTEYFDVTSEYAYTYELDGWTEELPVQNSPDDDMKYTAQHDVIYSVEARPEVETTSDLNVIAYVNTAGSLYKATNLAEVTGSTSFGRMTISGKITLDDISNSGSGKDPGIDNHTATTPYTETASHTAWFYHNGNNTREMDLSDATIDNSEYLRQISQYTNIETLIFPKNCENIPDGCCYGNGNSGASKLKSVTFPENLKTIGRYAFHDTSLTELTLPGSITSVGEYAFYTCKNLENVEMESLDGACTFGDWVFAASGVKHVTLSEGVDAISAHMFDACGSLESIRIPTTAKKIKTEAFTACASLHKLVIPEGVEELEKNIFNLAGLTDIYVMATSEEKVPKIYDVGNDGNAQGTFTKRNILGNNTAPNKTYGTDYDEATPEETALSWYQEEFSDMDFGIGGNNCMIQLHYPENMKNFYNGVKNIPADWKDKLCSFTDKELAEYQVGQAKEWISEIYAYGSQEYHNDPGWNSAAKIGPTEGNLYWPKAQDYYIRLAIGYTPGDEPTSAAWRQIPLQGIATVDDITFTKKYDDTWYTMCFPWDMDDNTLFSTFNQKCEIVEFKGAEVFQDPKDEYNYNLVFHFDEVVKTHYMNEDHSKEYERIESEHSRTVEIKKGTATISKKYYTYKNLETNELVYWPYHTGSAASAEEKAMQKEYNEILHLMVFAGHPYMIHPSIGAKAGQPKNCTIAGVKKIVPGEGLYASCATLADVAESQKQEYTVTSKVAGSTAEAEAWKNPVTGAGGKYTFIGNINDAKETDDPKHPGAQNMPTDDGPVYFLGLKPGTDYPQFFKKPQGKGAGKWSQYSAIIVPDADAVANVEGLDGMKVTNPDTPAKGYDVAFGEWEVVDEATVVTAIENAQAEAEETGKPAQITHMNVVYNIKGQVVRADSSSVEGLPKGLYIVNGKKYMVK